MALPSKHEELGRRLLQVEAFAFPVLLWGIAFLFLRGGTGWWADDYYHNQRLPDGSLPPLNLSWKWPLWSLGVGRGFFIRPLLYQVVPSVTTLTWKHPWVEHFIQAICHAGVAWLVWRLLRTLRLSRSAATAGALLFLVYPAPYEAVMWAAALPTVLSVAAMLGVMFLMVRFSRAGRGGWWRVPFMGAITFAACCLNEQPVAGVAAMPLVYWCVAEERWTKRGLARAILPAAACALAALLYIWLLTSTAPPGVRGSSETLVAIADAPAHFVDFAKQVARRAAMIGYGAGAWKLGVGSIESAGWMSLGMIALLILSGVAWTVRKREVVPAETAPPSRRRWIVLLGAAWFAFGYLPVAVVAIYPPDSRTRYWPAIGLAIVVAALLERVRGTMVGRAVLAAALIACCVTLVGMQEAYRLRWMQDQSEGAQLRALVPNPPPFTLFQPMDVRTTGIRTGSEELDTRFHGVWWFLWSTRKFVQEVYGRDDVSAMYWEGQIGIMPYTGGDEKGLKYTLRLGPRYVVRDGEGSRLSWDKLVPFIVDEDGRVRLVTEFVIPAPSGMVTIHVPQSAGAAPLEVRLPRR